MALIKLEGMEFKAFHGLYPEERVKGNLFTVDLSFEADTTQAQQTDDIADTVDYVAIYHLVEKEMKYPSNLLEHLAQRIKYSVENNHSGIANVQVTVSKQKPPVNGTIQKVTVVL
ncbi:MAG: dihydroneopterin aldolase [Sphingobacteriales bacterium JAD_PAG50586_3]|nr:MAG: dihydroneopterin aldolase [Sphingobacteriales bacterium JAD_PAG50586_3]